MDLAFHCLICDWQASHSPKSGEVKHHTDDCKGRRRHRFVSSLGNIHAPGEGPDHVNQCSNRSSTQTLPKSDHKMLPKGHQCIRCKMMSKVSWLANCRGRTQILLPTPTAPTSPYLICYFSKQWANFNVHFSGFFLSWLFTNPFFSPFLFCCN